MDKTNLPKPKRPLAGRWIDVFKAGTNTDSKGNVSTFTHGDLDQIVTNHALGAAPAVLGHPKDNDPAFAWTEDVKREGDLLFVKFKDVNPAFDAGVDSGAYRNRSVRLTRDPVHGLRLRHVGWLGAMPPAIDGLSTNFSSGDDYMEFSAPYASRTAWALDSIGSMFRAVREMVIADKGVEQADKVIPNYQIDSIESAVADLRNEAAATSNTNFSNGDETMNFTQEQLDAATAQAKKDAEAAATQQFNAQITEANQRADKIEAERRTERIGTQIEGWKKEGKVLPAEATGLAEFMSNLETAPQTFEFAAADGAATKKTPGEWFAEFMKAQPHKIALGDKSKHEGDTNADLSASQLSDKIQEYRNAQSAKGITVSYAEAMQVIGQ